MDEFIVLGGKPLTGKVCISGAKNAVLPIMAASIIKPAKYTIKNVPNLKDTRTMLTIIESTGAEVDFNDSTLFIDTRDCNKPIAPYNLVKTMRASFYMLGPFMSRFDKATVSLPGGCAWGPRPVDFHIKALEKMGAKITLKDGNIICEGKLRGAVIKFSKKSVGATGNILMAASQADGETKIINAACEPEIVDLCNFLELMKVEIKGIGTSKLTVVPNKEEVSNIEYEVIPDRIEAGTFMIGALITKGDVILQNVNASHLEIVIEKIREAGGSVSTIDSSTIRVRYNGDIKSVSIETKEYPGYPTDLQAQWMALMAVSNGDSTIKESIYKDRFTHISELVRFGAQISFDGNEALIKGRQKLVAAPVMSTDIRASASLILAALSAEGESNISRIYHIDRGYEDIEGKIKALGGNIVRAKT